MHWVELSLRRARQLSVGQPFRLSTRTLPAYMMSPQPLTCTQPMNPGSILYCRSSNKTFCRTSISGRRSLGFNRHFAGQNVDETRDHCDSG
jgi:hypothetical protein